MSMSREATKYHEQYEQAPESIRWAVDAAYDQAILLFKCAGLPTSNSDAAETLVADLFKYVIAAKAEQDNQVGVAFPVGDRV